MEGVQIVNFTRAKSTLARAFLPLSDFFATTFRRFLLVIIIPRAVGFAVEHRNDCGGGVGRQSPSLMRITAGNGFRASSWLHFSNSFLLAARLSVGK